MDRGGLRVLVAEDEALIRMDLVETLAELGFEVVASVGDGRSAVEAAGGFDQRSLPSGGAFSTDDTTERSGSQLLRKEDSRHDERSANREKDVEQNLRNLRGTLRDAAESHRSGSHGNDKKNGSPLQEHGSLLLAW